MPPGRSVDRYGFKSYFFRTDKIHDVWHHPGDCGLVYHLCRMVEPWLVKIHHLGSQGDREVAGYYVDQEFDSGTDFEFCQIGSKLLFKMNCNMGGNIVGPHVEIAAAVPEVNNVAKLPVNKDRTVQIRLNYFSVVRKCGFFEDSF